MKRLKYTRVGIEQCIDMEQQNRFAGASHSIEYEKSISRGSSDVMNSSSRWIKHPRLSTGIRQSLVAQIARLESLKDSVCERFVHVGAGYSAT